jgi:hypothetical protein
MRESDLQYMDLSPIQKRKFIQILLSVKNVLEAPAAIVQLIYRAGEALKKSSTVRKQPAAKIRSTRP